ncbi:hypothetical protein AnigIFM60653_001278 [Aspergillus niger]|nr:hypothetical protein AnigIFM60653_001278 [Aspergillus niger]
MSIVSTDTTESNYPPETDSSGTVTSYMPLTSVWTASSGCESKFRLDGPSLMAWDPGYMLDVDTNARCCPPQMVTQWEQNLLGVGGQYHTQMDIAWAMATTTLTTDSTVGAIDIVGWEIKFPVTATAKATSTSTSTASISSTLTSLPSATEDSNTASGNALSAGAKAGIGIGVGVGAVGIIALILALFLFNKRKRLAMSNQQPVAAYAYYPPIARNARPAELPGYRGMPGDAWASSPVEMGER